MSSSRESRFVVDGYERARAAAEPQIRADVEQEYAIQLVNASVIERWRLKREMARVIAKRIDQAAPPDALY
jgi:hypothetical protein